MLARAGTLGVAVGTVASVGRGAAARNARTPGTRTLDASPPPAHDRKSLTAELVRAAATAVAVAAGGGKHTPSRSRLPCRAKTVGFAVGFAGGRLIGGLRSAGPISGGAAWIGWVRVGGADWPAGVIGRDGMARPRLVWTFAAGQMLDPMGLSVRCRSREVRRARRETSRRRRPMERSPHATGTYAVRSVGVAEKAWQRVARPGLVPVPQVLRTSALVLPPRVEHACVTRRAAGRGASPGFAFRTCDDIRARPVY